MTENRTSLSRIRSRAMSGLLMMAGIFGLLTTVSCNNEKASQAEAKAEQAEKKVTELSAELERVKAGMASDKKLVDDLHGKVMAAEARAKAAPAVAAIDKIQAAMTQGAAVRPAAPAAKPIAVAKEPAELPDAIRVHSLAASAGEAQIATEYKEMAPALKACDKDGKLGLALCVLPKQGEYSSWLPVLVTWNDGAVPTIADARKVLGCLQQQWKVNSVVNKTGKNAPELVVRSSFTGECLAQPAE